MIAALLLLFQMTVSPASLAFTANQGRNPQPQTIWVQGAVSDMTLATSVDWLALSVANAGSGVPARVTMVQPKIEKLPPGKYSAEVKISQTVVPVTLEIFPAGYTPLTIPLVKQAEKELQTGPLSVMHKSITPSSGDKHDYISVGPYWWPDPTKPNGLPYIRKDGERNPERNDNRTDSTEIHTMFSSVFTLMLAYRETQREDFAKHAAELLRGWFLDPATRMNPNLNFGQAVPGHVEGRGTGIIDTAGLVELTRGLDWLAKSPSWTPADQAGMKKWCADYLHWLQTSKNGKEEADAKNNHGTWYDAQVVSLAMVAGETDLAKRTLEAAKKKRIDSEIKEDGSMPLELERTKSFAYSLMNLRAFFELATMGDKLGVDLWNTRIRAALDYLAPYAPDPYTQDATRWPHDELGGVTRADLIDLLALLRRGALAYHKPGYDRATCNFSADVATARFQILWGSGWEVLCH